MENARILATIREDKIERYRAELDDLSLSFTATTDHLLDMLSESDISGTLAVVDHELDLANTFVPQLREKYPALCIIIVDEDADFGTPGHADDLSCDPFRKDELKNKINRLLSGETSAPVIETPSVRTTGHIPRSATRKPAERIGIALKAMQEMGFDYAAYYFIDQNDPSAIMLLTQRGPTAVNAIAPESGDSDDLIGYVAYHQESRIAGPLDTPTHPLVARGRLGAVVCIPVTYEETRFGVLVACNDRPGSIRQDSLPQLEMVATQLAASLNRSRKQK